MGQEPVLIHAIGRRRLLRSLQVTKSQLSTSPIYSVPALVAVVSTSIAESFWSLIAGFLHASQIDRSQELESEKWDLSVQGLRVMIQ